MKTTLGLELATDPRWADLAGKDLSYILSDHAWCEQKAASSGISLISRFSEFDGIVEEVSPVVAEEWGHFRMVLKQLQKRGFELDPQRKDQYVNRLREFVMKGVSRADMLVDSLLMMAMIEARSCERFKMLHEQLEDDELRKFYYDFMVSEAGHYKLFLKLAKKHWDEDKVNKRWQEWISYEAEMIQTLELRSDRMH